MFLPKHEAFSSRFSRFLIFPPPRQDLTHQHQSDYLEWTVVVAGGDWNQLDGICCESKLWLCWTFDHFNQVLRVGVGQISQHLPVNVESSAQTQEASQLWRCRIVEHINVQHTHNCAANIPLARTSFQCQIKFWSLCVRMWRRCTRCQNFDWRRHMWFSPWLSSPEWGKGTIWEVFEQHVLMTCPMSKNLM